MKKILTLIGLLSFSPLLLGGSIINSRHDLSTATTNQPCVFCHIPHNANTGIAGPLWNRAQTTQTFTVYASQTMDAAVDPPHVASRLCLSCHDGVSANTNVGGHLINTKHAIVVAPGGQFPANMMTTQQNCVKCHSSMDAPPLEESIYQSKVAGVDLSDDHPISMLYPAVASDEFNTPPDAQKGWGGSSKNDVKLFAGYVECSSCHNVHNPDNGAFLRKSNLNSALCLTCHNK